MQVYHVICFAATNLDSTVDSYSFQKIYLQITGYSNKTFIFGKCTGASHHIHVMFVHETNEQCVNVLTSIYTMCVCVNPICDCLLC